MAGSILSRRGDGPDKELVAEIDDERGFLIIKVLTGEADTAVRPHHHLAEMEGGEAKAPAQRSAIAQGMTIAPLIERPKLKLETITRWKIDRSTIEVSRDHRLALMVDAGPISDIVPRPVGR